MLGEGNRVFAHAVIGFEPQDLKYRGEKTSVRIGNHNVFREFSTIHRGTASGNGETLIGDNYFMACSHVAHDCRFGPTALAQSAGSPGTSSRDRVVVGPRRAHQFIRSVHAFVGAYAQIRRMSRRSARPTGSSKPTESTARPSAPGFSGTG